MGLGNRACVCASSAATGAAQVFFYRYLSGVVVRRNSWGQVGPLGNYRVFGV